MSEEQTAIEAEQAAEGGRGTGGLSLRSRFLLDLGPLLAFFISYFIGDIFWATGAFMAATVVAIAVYWRVERKIPVVQWISGIIVVGFGALTLLLDDPRFIKMKPTLIYAMFAGILFFGVFTGRPLLKLVLEVALPPLTHEGWRTLSLRWAWFFLFMAGVNEFVWRLFSESFWVSFKLFGFLPLIMLFSVFQSRVIQAHLAETDTSPAE